MLKPSVDQIYDLVKLRWPAGIVRFYLRYL